MPLLLRISVAYAIAIVVVTVVWVLAFLLLAQVLPKPAVGSELHQELSYLPLIVTATVAMTGATAYAVFQWLPEG